MNHYLWNLKNRIEKHRIGKAAVYFLTYTVLFLALSLFVFSFFYKNGKLIMFGGDSTTQDFHAVVYFSRYLKNVVRTLIQEHTLVLPMWDHSIGMGADILLTLHYYVIGDPLNFLSVLVPERFLELYFCLLAVFKFYLAGITFSLFCFYHKNGRFQTMLGAFVYAFSGYMLLVSVNHMMFAAPVIWLPLVLIGADMILDKKKPYLFIFSLTLAAYSNFYFFYMICIMTALYVVFRYLMKTEHFEWKHCILCVLQFLLYAVTAVLLAAPLLLPIAYELTGTGRFSADHYIPVIYEFDFYLTWLTGIMTRESYWVGYWTYFGYTAAAFFAMLFLFTRKGCYKALKRGIIVLILFMAIPYMGHVINGFSYACNRWNWAFGMLIAYTLVKMYPEFLNRDEKQEKKLIIVLLVYAAVCVFWPRLQSKESMTAIVMLFALFAAVYACQSGKINLRILQVVFLITVLGGIYMNSYFEYSSREGDGVITYTDKGAARAQIEQSAVEAVKATEDEDMYRFDQYGVDKTINSSMTTGVNGTGFYFSMCNGAISQFNREIELCYPLEYRIYNLDGRAFLDALSSIKYFLIETGNTQYLPYGYDEQVLEKGTYTGSYSVYRGENTLPFGYTYDSWIPREEYEALSATKKQQAMLQSVVLDESTLPQGKPQYTDQQFDYEITDQQGLSVQDGKIEVREAGASMKLCFDQTTTGEVYLEWKNLVYSGMDPMTQYGENWDTMKPFDKNQIRMLEEGYREPETATIKATLGDVTKSNQIRTNKSTSYCGRHDFIYNMGNKDSGSEEMTLTFLTVGVYSFDELNIIGQPVEELQEFKKQRMEEVLSELTCNTDCVKGNISLNTRKILCMPIPYSKGWTAEIDGEKTQVMQANTAFMAIEVPEGNHEIVFSYRTPMQKAGFAGFGAGVLLLGMLVLLGKRRQHE